MLVPQKTVAFEKTFCCCHACLQAHCAVAVTVWSTLKRLTLKPNPEPKKQAALGGTQS